MPSRASASWHGYALRKWKFGAVRAVLHVHAGKPANNKADDPEAHATQPKYVHSFAYRVGDVVIWDNASLLHSATLTDPDDPRTLWRITIKESSAKLDALDVLAPTFASDSM